MWYKTNKKLPLKKILDNVQLNLNVSNPDILNTMDMSKRFLSPNHFFSRFYPQYLNYLDIFKFLYSPL